MTITNMRFNATSEKIERFRNDKGQNMIRVQAKTMPAGVVMNRIKFIEDNVKEKMHSLNDTLAPLGHPDNGPDGEPMSAKDTNALMDNFIFAKNENIRWEESDKGGRVALDVLINEDKAKALAKVQPKIQEFLRNLDQNKQVNTSVGLTAKLTDAKGHNFNKIAEVQHFDHNAILMDEKPASSPEEGTGLNMSKSEFLTFNMDADNIESPEEIDKMSFETVKKWIFDAVRTLPEKTEETSMSDTNANAQESADKAEGVTMDEIKDILKSFKDEVVEEMTAKFQKDTEDTAESEAASKEAAERKEAIDSLVNSGTYDEGEITDDIPTEFLKNQVAKKQKAEVSHISASSADDEDRDDTKLLDFASNYKENDDA